MTTLPTTDELLTGRSHRPKVLVLLASYNGSQWIGGQLSSVLGQTDVDVHIVVSDDKSTDNTVAVVRDFMAKDSRVELSIRPEATGSPAGNFFSLIRDNAFSDFDAVAFADQDDLWDPDKLSKACGFLSETPDGGSAGYASAVICVWSDGQRRTLRPNPDMTSADFLFESAGQGCTYVVSASFYERVRRFVVAHPYQASLLRYHDWAIYALARSWNLQWTLDTRPSMCYRQHSGNDTGARISLQGAAKRFQLIRTGWYSEQIAAITDWCTIAAPEHPVIVEWRSLLSRPDGIKRRLLLFAFCVRGGRRRRIDNAILLLAILLGWIQGRHRRCGTVPTEES